MTTRAQWQRSRRPYGRRPKIDFLEQERRAMARIIDWYEKRRLIVLKAMGIIP